MSLPHPRHEGFRRVLSRTGYQSCWGGVGATIQLAKPPREEMKQPTATVCNLVNRSKLTLEQRKEIRRVRMWLYEGNKRRTDPNYRMYYACKARMHKKLKQVGAAKADGTHALLGCNTAQLRAWLESKFQRGMTWANYGAWHIDHVVPASKFDLTDPAQQRAAFHYTNLQPLWAAENIRKSNKIHTPIQPQLALYAT